MSKKNKIVYSDIQPNAKEAGVWVNTTDGNIKIEKDGKWVDDGGSSSGSGSGDDNFIYYKLDKNYNIMDHIYDYDETQYLITHMRAQLNGDRYMYGTFAAVVRYFGKQSQNPYPDAFVFAPMSLFLGSDIGYVTTNSYEEAMKIFPDVFPPATRITAEEYWEHLKAE